MTPIKPGFSIENVHDLEVKGKDFLLEEISSPKEIKIEEETKGSRIYFGRFTEQKIREFLKETNIAKRDQLFRTYIHPKLFKLVESVIFSYGFNRIRNENNSIKELINEVISDIVIKGFPEFDPERGKAFSYFSKIAKNYLLRKMRYENRYVGMSGDDDDESGDPNMSVMVSERILEMEEFVEEDMVGSEYLDAITTYFINNEFRIASNPNELRVLNALIDIFQYKYQLVNICFKKQAQELIKELCPELSHFQIKTSLKNIGRHYYEARAQYVNNNM
jgi:hypothetical protein